MSRHLVKKAFVLSALLAGGAVYGTPVAAQDWQTLSQSRKFAREDALKVDVGYAAGRLNIGPGTDAVLYKADLRYDADIFKRPRMTYKDGSFRVDMSDGSVKGRNMKAGKLDLRFGTRVPLDIDLAFGAAEAQIELGGLMVRTAKIQTGASQTTLRVSRVNRIPCRLLTVEVGAARFEAIGLGNLNVEQMRVSGGVGEVILDYSGSAKQDIETKVEMGLGSLVIRVPRGTALRVKKEGLLASFDSEGLVKRGDAFYSENWKSAQRHVTVDIEAAFGSIKVEWLDR